MLLDNRYTDRDANTLSVIQSLPYIAHAREGRLAEYALRQLQTNEELHVRFQPTFYSNTVEALVAFACEGLGVALLPDLAVVDELECGALVKVFPQHTLEEEPIYAVHAYDMLPPRSVLEVIAAVQAELKR